MQLQDGQLCLTWKYPVDICTILSHWLLWGMICTRSSSEISQFFMIVFGSSITILTNCRCWYLKTVFYKPILSYSWQLPSWKTCLNENTLLLINNINKYKIIFFERFRKIVSIPELHSTLQLHARNVFQVIQWSV